MLKMFVRVLTSSSTVSTNIVPWLSHQIKQDFVISFQIGHKGKLSDTRWNQTKRAAREKLHIESTHVMLGSTAAGKNHNFFLVVCRSASVFPLTSTTP